ncbi:hypothetical protein IU436_23785 [Nocardia farcinica]|uniref:hypothetical protein n=1 Tax=Nocardia farcinica TaxID=37329 RepID=UPI0018960E12|nr:hypothetical protein [Nocardia farcinica]MBF6360802.1 hypothetical protein [Nocardia farcinica]MBF6386863.1 hypothetical protein [Nocardia farcinica]MBF6421714.1 hypothetical protein [Nocardia farcinica]MBF6433371.1 hypothetical protein [Nocardia farcinica]MBF6504189.1 hypothetical protein [Nocardia farcinica]
MRNQRWTPLTPSGHLRMRPGDFESVEFLELTGVLAGHRIVTSNDLIPHVAITWFDRSAQGYASLGWRSDGCYYFSADLPGEEHRGLVQAAHYEKPIHLFTRHWSGRAQTTRYIDEFVLEDILEPTEAEDHAVRAYWSMSNHTVVEDALESRNFQPVYKLRPIETVAHVPGQLGKVCHPDTVSLHPVERHDLLGPTDDIDVTATVRPENRLVLDFCRHLQRRNHSVQRLAIRHTAGHKPLFTDIWVDTASLLIEAKVHPNRDSIRAAIGQMADYTRFLPTPRRAILLSGRPEKDLIDLAHSQQCALIWPSLRGDEWTASAAWLIDLLLWPDGELGRWLKRFPEVHDPYWPVTDYSEIAQKRTPSAIREFAQPTDGDSVQAAPWRR